MINITREQFFDFVKTEKDKENLITTSTQHYLSFFDQYKKTGKKGNWNWGGWLPLWWFYRRMYVYGLSIGMIGKFLFQISDKILQYCGINSLQNIMDFILFICLSAICMRYADYGYLCHASKKISKGKKESGVNKIAVVLLTSIVFLLFLIFLFTLIMNEPNTNIAK